MAFLDAYTLHAVGVNSTLIDQVTARGFEAGRDFQRFLADGGADPEFGFVNSISPSGTITTNGVDKGLTVAGIGGTEITAGLDLWYQKVDPNGVRESGSNHARVTLGTGLIVPRSISADNGGPASMTFEVFGVSSDGTTAPHSIATGAALGETSSINEAFTLGGVTLNGGALDGVQSVEIDFGIRVELQRANGEPYPRLAYIAERQPVITITALDIAGLVSSDFVVGEGIATTSTITLQAVTQNGTRAGTGDIVCTVNEGLNSYDSNAGDGNTPDTCTITIRPTYDGSNAILAFS